MRTTVRISLLDEGLKPALEQLHAVIAARTNQRLTEALDQKGA